PRPARRRGRRRPRDPRRARPRGLGRLLRPRDLQRQRRLRGQLSGFALGRLTQRPRGTRRRELHRLLAPTTSYGMRGEAMTRSSRARIALVVVAVCAGLLAATAAARTDTA